MNLKRLITICMVVCLGLGAVSSAALVDLSVDLNGFVTPALGPMTFFERFDPNPSTGTGNFEPFVRIQANDTEKGYNTDGTVEFDTKGGKWTHSIKLGDIPVIAGSFEFLLDIDQNQGQDNELLSLDGIEIYLAASAILDSYPALGVKVYDLGANWVKMDNTLFKPGSGTGDVRMLIPDNQGWDKSKYLYFYSEFGSNNNSNDGFEEWGTIVPEPATIVMLALGAFSFIRRK